MVGEFGEVQVMDWGLADYWRKMNRRIKVPLKIGRSSVDWNDEWACQRLDSEPVGPHAPSALTIAGDVLGTPAYMPPEQARGDLAALSPRSDVFCSGRYAV